MSETEQEIKKNPNDVSCQFCNTLILKPQAAIYVLEKTDLPLMRQKSQQDGTTNIETEAIEEFFVVDDMFTFENMGFSYTVSNKKYLVCADCEMGPVGFFDTNTKKGFVALSRVKHE